MTHIPLLAVITLAIAASAAAQTPPTQQFPLTDTQGLVAKGVTVDVAEFLGRKAVRLANPEKEAGYLMLPGTDFQDGTIEADVAVKITLPPGTRMPGFIGLAFRAKDSSSYDMFYVRPGNATAEDQAMRNHAAQYTASPTYGWYQLRRAWPFVYEAHADLKLDAWTHMKIDVAGRVAKLYLNGSSQPTLVVDGMKGENLRGGIMLFGYSGEDSYFSNIHVTNKTPLPIKNGSDATGTWNVKLSTDAGVYAATLQLQRDGNNLTGTWSGQLGDNRAVKGTWRDGYVELSFMGEWPQQPSGGDGAPGPVLTTLAGWIDGDAGKGRGKVEARADGVWMATKKS